MFEDLHLQHVNPFDETFRRAVESKNDADTPTNLPPSIDLTEDETLHTPHVLPFFSNTNVKKSNLDESKTTTRDHSTKNNIKSSIRTNLNGKIKKSEKVTKLSTQSINHSATQYLIQPLNDKANSIPKLQSVQPTSSSINGHQLTLPTNILQVQLVTSTALAASNKKVKVIPTKHRNTPLLLPKAITEQNLSTNLVRERLKAVLTKNTVNLQNVSQSKSKTIRKTIEKKKSAPLDQQPVISKITSADRKNAAAVRYR